MPVFVMDPGILGTLKWKFTLFQVTKSGITICTGSPILIIFQSGSNSLFHFHDTGMVVPPVAATRDLPVKVDVSDFSGISHGAAFVMAGFMSCSSIIDVAREYDWAELLILPLDFARLRTFSRKVTVRILSSTTIMSATMMADPRCE